MTTSHHRLPTGRDLLVAAALCLCLSTVYGCESGDCTTEGCEQNLACNEATGECTDPNILCEEAGCPDGQVCDPQTGRCLDRGSFCRLPGDTSCQEENCSTCPEGQACDTQSGFCVAGGECRYTECPRAEACNAETQACEAVSCNADEDCPSGSICIGDLCQVGCREQRHCRDGETCAGASEGVVGNCRTACTSHDECDWGDICVLEGSGQSNCQPEPPCASDNDCRQGETCRAEVCRRALCDADNDCLSSEYCFTDTGECLTDDCQPDTYEPNNDASEAKAILSGDFVGLTLCRGEEDWFVISGEASLRISLLHAIENDLDLEAYVGGRLVASAGQGRNSETIFIPASEAEDVVVRIIPIKGQNAPYFLQIAEVSLSCVEDLNEPNDTPAEATPLAAGDDLSVTVCPGDRDLIRATRPDSGPITLEGTLTGSISAQISLALGDAPLQTLVPDEAGHFSLSLAHLDHTAGALINAASSEEASLTLRALAEGPLCEDVTAENHTPQSAAALDIDLDTPIEARPQALCRLDDEAGPTLESDWYVLNVPEGALEIDIAVENLSAPSPWDTPLVRATLATGDAAPWRSASASAGLSASLSARISRLDRPIYLRLDTAAGLPKVLSAWPTYQHTINVSAATGCVQDRSEAGGNNTLARATPLNGTINALLCPGDIDVFAVDLSALEEGAPFISLAAPESPVDYVVQIEEGGEALASGRVSPEEGVVTVLEGLELPEETTLLWVVLRATGEVPVEGGAVYTIDLQ